MKWWLGQGAARFWLLVIVSAASGCQLVTGVNDLRVDEEGTDDTDVVKDGGDDKSDDSDPSRPDARLPDASEMTSEDTSDATSHTSGRTSHGSSGTTTRDASVSDDTSEDTDGESSSGQSTGDSGTPTQTTSAPNSNGTDISSDTPDAGEPDGGGCQIPAQLACAPITNCGCGEGTVCTVAQGDDQLEVACTSAGTAALGDACEPGDCASGYHCWQGICRQACLRDNDCEEEGASCEVLDVEEGPLSKVRYCDAPCDLTAPSMPSVDLHACPDGQACVRTLTSSVCTSSVGDGTSGVSCERDTDCAIGFGCINQVCKAWCDPANDGCGTWAECQMLTDVVDSLGPVGACEGTCEIAAAAGSTCGVLPDCGCSGGQSCRVVDEDGRTECSVIGLSGEQEYCEADYDCQPELTCVSWLCRPFCDLNAPNCAGASGCFPFYIDGTAVEDVGFCGGSCDPVWPATDDETYTPCGSGAVCEVGFSDADLGVPHCRSVEDVNVVDYGDACEPGYDICENGSGCTGTCEFLCREDNDCSSLTPSPECLATSEQFLDTDGSELGVCCELGPIADSECSSFADSCGCAEGEACRMALDSLSNFYLDGRTACSEAGDVTEQNPCVDDTDCVRGMSCVDNLCRPHCETECPDTEGTCIQIRVGEDFVPGAHVCLGLCDPRAPEDSTAEWGGCGTGVKCIPGTPNDVDYPLSQCSVSSGDVDLGGACEFHTECNAGLACICTDDSCTEATCQPWCLSDDDCEGVETCIPIDGQIKPGFPLGFCGE